MLPRLGLVGFASPCLAFDASVVLFEPLDAAFARPALAVNPSAYDLRSDEATR